MTPAQEFRHFILTGTRGKEVISPTLLKIKLDLLVRQEKVFARDAYYVGHREGNFEEWYEDMSKDKEPSKSPKTVIYPISEPDELYP